MPVTLTTRAEKGSILSLTEMDKNLTDLRDAVNVARVETVTETSVAVTAGTKQVILCDATANNMVITLPAAASSTDVIYHIKKVDSSANTVTVDGDGTETIDGALTKVISAQYDLVSVISNGSNWYIL